jgi:16S rRNA (guanine527-N7)-methyltransferase
VRPDLRFTLLDSLQKRVGFLQTVAETLELANVTAVHARAEDAGQDLRFREQFTIAMARAVAALPVLEELLLPFVRVGGKSICYKGPSVEEELPAGKAAVKILGGDLPDVKAVFIPHLSEWKHCLVICEKRRHTPAHYPRRAGVPFKIPLGMKKETEI